MIFFFHSEIKEQDTLEIKKKKTIKMLLNLELVFVLVLAMKYSRFWFRSPEKLKKSDTEGGTPAPFLTCPFMENKLRLKKFLGRGLGHKGNESYVYFQTDFFLISGFCKFCFCVSFNSLVIYFNKTRNNNELKVFNVWPREW